MAQGIGRGVESEYEMEDRECDGPVSGFEVGEVGDRRGMLEIDQEGRVLEERKKLLPVQL